eukprot:Protomagalhaensia_sp_Gyna_25__5091@NODE_582_length_3071_cov_72_807388_g450_i0_p1_GENE_NODE_582_length_3071_cov_72_807388_g450_i0NODE_582_length_3071_cov_72_807388_g450_i0_p1_ORF_typecomplete_len469_score33_26_NODE_582_length_3071_cov_72_807388_g450_i03391745
MVYSEFIAGNHNRPVLDLVCMHSHRLDRLSWLGWLRALWITFIGFMLLDGVQVAFSNAVDIDCGGLDYLSSVYDLPLTDFLRYRFTTVHQLVFDSSFVFFTPPVVVGLVFLYSWWTRSSSRDFLPVYITGTDLSVFVLTMGVAVVFGLLSLLSFRYYYKGIPPVDTVDTSHQGSVLTRSLSDSNPPANRRTSSDRVVAWDYKAKLWEIADGFFIVASDKALKWRLVLLAVETALEDTMVSVIIPITALHATAFVGHTSSKTAAALINVVTIAVGKLGGVLAGVYLASSWSYDGICSRNGKRLFELVLFSSLSLILIPIGYTLAASGLHNHVPIESTIVSDISAASVFQWLSDRSGILGCIALLTGVALFFIFSTAPKIGFASLIQSLVTNEDDVAKVFSFVGMFVTIADGLMIAFINLVLYWIPDFELGLWVVFGIYAIHGLLEYFFGSQLIAEAPSGGLRAYRMEHD